VPLPSARRRGVGPGAAWGPARGLWGGMARCSGVALSAERGQAGLVATSPSDYSGRGFRPRATPTTCSSRAKRQLSPDGACSPGEQARGSYGSRRSADVVIAASDRRGLERISRYLARPPLGRERPHCSVPRCSRWTLGLASRHRTEPTQAVLSWRTALPETAPLGSWPTQAPLGRPPARAVGETERSGVGSSR
jgi:hypothetical protein